MEGNMTTWFANTTSLTLTADTTSLTLTAASTTMKEIYRQHIIYRDLVIDFYHATLGITVMIICIIGMLANMLNIATLSMIIRNSKLPVYRCFLGLAIADFFVVLFTSIRYGSLYLVRSDIPLYGSEVRARLLKRDFNCIYHLMPHLTNVVFAASNWCVVAMSTLRLIAVFTPLWYQGHCTTKVVNIVLVSVYVLSVVINVPSFIVTRYNTTTNLFEEKVGETVQLIGFNPKLLSMIAIQIIPMLLTAALLVPLIWKLCTRAAIERSASNAEYRSRDKLQASITLVCISAFYVICVTPGIVYWSINYLGEKSAPSPKAWYRGVQAYTITQVCFVINYTANFCFYVLLNARLRNKLKKILSCSKGSGRDQARSFACITHQSSLSERRLSADPAAPDHGSTIGWSPLAVVNGKQKKTEHNRNGQWRRRMNLSNQSHAQRRTTELPKKKLVFRVDQNSETDKLLEESNATDSTPIKQQRSSPGVHDSTSTRHPSSQEAPDKSLREYSDPSDNYVADKNGRAALLYESAVSSSQNSYNSYIRNDAPIATIDTMHDLETECSLTH